MNFRIFLAPREDPGKVPLAKATSEEHHLGEARGDEKVTLFTVYQIRYLTATPIKFYQK
jgi:hypothetical protein